MFYLSRLGKIPVTLFAILLSILLLSACDSPEERMQSHYERGQEFLDNGEHIKAGLEFRNALTINEEFLPALRGLAIVEERKANWRVVAGVLRRIVNLEPNDIEARVKLAKLMLFAGQTGPALELSNEANGIVEKSADAVTSEKKAEALAVRALVLYRLGDTAGAVLSANEAIDANPSNVSALVVLERDSI